MKIDAIKIKEKDNVATALRDLSPHETVRIREGDEMGESLVEEHIPYGHKFALRDIRKGEKILKYGEVIGQATGDISSGTHVHVQNVESLRGRGDLKS